ncbi:hypothetical protein HYQ46_002971 [Verticillium longisporum]|nr:hypothetical protein HYQ46_002971 [Verticillium longisporum]
MQWVARPSRNLAQFSALALFFGPKITVALTKFYFERNKTLQESWNYEQSHLLVLCYHAVTLHLVCPRVNTLFTWQSRLLRDHFAP